MSVMSAAEAGQPAGTSPEIFPRGPWMARSATDRDGTDPEATSSDEGAAEADPSPLAGPDRRLRLVAAELHVTEVRVAREISTRTLRAGDPKVRAPRLGTPRTSAPRVGGPRVSAEWAGSSRSSAQRTGGLRTGAQRVSAQQVSVQSVSAERASVQRAGGPGANTHRLLVQRVRAQQVSVRGTSTQPGGLRLTRRGRRVLTGFVMLVIVVSAMLIWTSVAGGAQAPGRGAPPSSAYQGLAQVVVQPGQTIWSIAAAAEPSADPWTVVQQISDANALNGTQIQAGQLLWVPRG